MSDYLGPRVVLVPDLGEDLARAVGELEALLLTLRAAEDDGAVLPGALAGGAALAALRRFWRAVAPTQGRRATAAWLPGWLYASSGRVELVPLRLVDVDPIDVATLSAAAVMLGVGVGAVREALEAGCADLSGYGLAAVAAGISGLLDLADTAESILLRERLGAAGPGADVVLTPVEEGAYQATADRLNAMWPRR
ncbi:hypothetical protein [Nonomuraea sp. NEAU-A123]|uniref:hypothetical protein n=1 Tax=Nonomuraea sp. NEAU-A123 TaxID=2839649 RepID=UPI001BE46975|nr:hypothetical protein [Nonomuraea sp. NEAU-A123]MBT2231126.1 hypothetical protein [Nonomuraea sp. NEAU-A123]